MIYELFFRIIDMSITASVVIIAVLIARGLMARLPKRYSYLLWAIVAVRLLCPVGIPSSFSVFNLFGEYNVLSSNLQRDSADQWFAGWGSGEEGGRSGDIAGQRQEGEGAGSSKESARAAKSAELAKDDEPVESTAQSGSTAESRTGMRGQSRKVISDTSEEDVQRWHGRLEPFVKYGTPIWFGVSVMLIIWNLLLMLLMQKRVFKAIRLRENIYECDDIPTPFVMGFLRPRIYIPFRMEGEEQDYIIRHESYHIARKDNLAKLVAFLITCVYWFHPLVWLSYFLMMRDMEMSCDEYVLQKSVRDIREDYSRSLLGLATNKRNMGAGLIAFGESNARRRVKHIMKFKKCGKWIGMIAIGAVLAVGAACLTDARRGDADGEKKSETAASQKPGTGDLADDRQFPVVASAAIDGYRLEVQCVTEEKKPKSGYYEGDALMIQTARDEKVVDRRGVSFGKGGKVYFPAKGIDISLADYDGDGRKNDFALGQGQGADPLLGNYMNYRFFGVDEDGSVAEYHTSTEDGASISTVPGKYSPLYSPVFKRKSGELAYQGLGEEGVENMTTTIVRYIPISDKKAEQEPMKSLKEQIRSKHMPAKIADELREKGVWHVMRGEGTEVQYNLANGEGEEEVTLRLDFTYVDGQLTDYVLKEYAFTEGMKALTMSEWCAKLCYFAEDFAGVKPTGFADGITIEELSAKIKKEETDGKKGVASESQNVIARAAWLEERDDEGREYYGDLEGAMYVWCERIGMVVGYERNAAKDGDAAIDSEILEKTYQIDADVPENGDAAAAKGEKTHVESSAQGGQKAEMETKAYGVRFTLPGGAEEVPVKQHVVDERRCYSYEQHPTGELVHVMVAKDRKAFERDFKKTNTARQYWSYFANGKEKLMTIDRYKDSAGKRSYAVCHWKVKGVHFWVFGKWSQDWVIFAKDAAEIAASL